MSLGVVTKHLFDLIAKQVEEHVYAAAQLKLLNTTVARYEGSFFQLPKLGTDYQFRLYR